MKKQLPEGIVVKLPDGPSLFFSFLNGASVMNASVEPADTGLFRRLGNRTEIPFDAEILQFRGIGKGPVIGEQVFEYRTGGT